MKGRCSISHVAIVEIEIKDLDALKIACQRLGMEFKEGQQSYRWFGHHVGDYPLPEGFGQVDLGKCEHAVTFSESVSRNMELKYGELPYEIGVCKRRDGKPGYMLLWDFFDGGFGLQDVVGQDCCKLRQEYARAVAVKTAQTQGFRVQEHRQQDGSIKLLLSK